MLRAGENIKYRSVGHLVCHIYFASSIETFENKDINVNTNSLDGQQIQYLFMGTIHRIIKSRSTYFTFKYLILHNISNSFFRESAITSVTYEPWQLLTLQSLVPR